MNVPLFYFYFNWSKNQFGLFRDNQLEKMVDIFKSVLNYKAVLKKLFVCRNPTDCRKIAPTLNILSRSQWIQYEIILFYTWKW